MIANRPARIESKKASQKPQDARNGEKRSRGQVAATDAAIYQRYWIVHGGKRGALTRTAEECSCSIQHVANVLSRHQAKAVPRGAPVPAWKSEPVEVELCHAAPPILVPGLTEDEVVANARTAADLALGYMIIALWLAVCFCWVPGVNALLGVAALIAGHLAADAGRVLREMTK